MTRSPAALVTGIDSPVTIDFVDGRAAFDDRRRRPAPSRPGRTRRRSPTADQSSAHILLRAVGLDASRGLGREIEQRADGARGLLAGAQLEHLAEQHQDGDDRGGLEIDRDRAVHAAEGGGKDARRQRGHDAVEPGHAGAERDQREHVEIARDERVPAAHEERPAGPQHDGRREHEAAASSNSCWPSSMCRSARCPPISSTTTGSGERRGRSRSAASCRRARGSGPSSAVDQSGSSAMPQIGQEPGPTWRISGCIGQV